jgi:hypothetical protein
MNVLKNLAAHKYMPLVQNNTAFSLFMGGHNTRGKAFVQQMCHNLSTANCLCGELLEVEGLPCKKIYFSGKGHALQVLWLWLDSMHTHLSCTHPLDAHLHVASDPAPRCRHQPAPHPQLPCG